MQDHPIRIDYALAMAAGVGERGGLTDAELDGQAGAVAGAVASLAQRAEAGSLGFWRLPDDREALAQCQAVARALPRELRDVLVLGIGGSSLGARALQQALAGPVEVPRQQDAALRLHLPDNSDPWLLSALLDRLEPRRTAALVVSKSGGTVETAAQSLVVRRWLEDALGTQATIARIVAITDPDKGTLREQVRRESLASLPIPENVGGRFSVLTAAGLMPAILMGIDCEALLSGAAAMARRCEAPALRDNPAAILAAIHVLHHQKGRPIHVLMPYSDRLRAFSAWYVQLWAESLGKRLDRRGRRVERGPTPLPAVGATDQHAQVQLFMEGPRDKLITFIDAGTSDTDLTIPPPSTGDSYLAGKTLGELLRAEREGTTQALATDGRPSLTLQLQRLDAHALGGLFFLYQAATAIAAELYDIDAFDQPGVELGKRLAFGLLGRQGFEATLEEIQQARADRPPGYRL